MGAQHEYRYPTFAPNAHVMLGISGVRVRVTKVTPTYCSRSPSHTQVQELEARANEELRAVRRVEPLVLDPRCVRACVRACMCACVRACVHACVRARVACEGRGTLRLSSGAAGSPAVHE